MSFKSVTVPVDAGLTRLLREAANRARGPAARRNLGELAATAERNPREGARTAQLQAPAVPVVADDLGRMLASAREAADPAADVLAAFLAREFGRSEAGVSGG
jgi:hypothetical protein